MQKKRREDDILLYKCTTNQQAFSASLREGGGPRSGGRSPRDTMADNMALLRADMEFAPATM